MRQAEFNFDGATFDAAIDGQRLGTQLQDVLNVMRDGIWRTLDEIISEIGRGTQTGISARLRDLRKPKFGGWIVESRRISGGGWEYRITKGAT
jgi:hypothetical protein